MVRRGANKDGGGRRERSERQTRPVKPLVSRSKRSSPARSDRAQGRRDGASSQEGGAEDQSAQSERAPGRRRPQPRDEDLVSTVQLDAEDIQRDPRGTTSRDSGDSSSDAEETS